MVCHKPYDYFFKKYNENKYIKNFKLDTFINYEHSHVSRYDWGIETRLNIDDGVLYFICKPNSYKLETMFIKNSEFNKNYEIMKLYFSISEKCIFTNLNIFINEKFLLELKSKEIDRINKMDKSNILKSLSNQKLKCPLCRATISGNKINTIFGIENECNICMDKKVDVFFQECGHACVCLNCLIKSTNK